MTEEKRGRLYLSATPIGNLEDMTFRAVRLLGEADLIAAEDTRHTRKLLSHYDIHTAATSYHEHNKVDKAAVLVEKMLSGQTIALITDAGTPGISDPGEELVRQAIDNNIEVIPIPGPVACINALIISGLPTRRFTFEAFLPFDKAERARVLSELKTTTCTIIIYEAPHKLVRTLKELTECLGGDRRIAVCKELTKKHERVYRATLFEAAKYYEENEPKGEYVLVIEGKNPLDIVRKNQEEWLSMSIEDHMNYYISQGIDEKEAMKKVAKDRGVSKRDIYQSIKI